MAFEIVLRTRVPSASATTRHVHSLLLNLVHELRLTLPLLRLDPVMCNVRLQIFQLLGRIHTTVTHTLSLECSQQPQKEWLISQILRTS